MTEIETLITTPAHILAQELRARGYAVTIFDEEELGGVEAKWVEQAMVDVGIEAIEILKDQA